MIGMTQRGFRTGRPTGRSPSDGAAGEVDPRRPFTQVQILDLMKVEFARARRYGFPVACIVLTVNRLAALTDMHGRELRDRVRGELCRLVREKTRSSDYLGTFGEDSYLVVLPHADERMAEAVGNRILRGFGDLYVEADGVPLRLCLGVGVAASEDRDTLFFDTLVSQAEIALQWSLDSGGDQVVVFDKSRFMVNEDDSDREPPG